MSLDPDLCGKVYKRTWLERMKDRIEWHWTNWEYKYVVVLRHPGVQTPTTIWDWLKEEVGRDNYYFRWHLQSIEQIEYRFRYKEDALLFKLRWS